VIGSFSSGGGAGGGRDGGLIEMMACLAGGIDPGGGGSFLMKRSRPLRIELTTSSCPEIATKPATKPPMTASVQLR
jgi:hypothetical protein